MGWPRWPGLCQGEAAYGGIGQGKGRVVVYPEIFEKTRPEPSGIPNGIPGIVFFFEFSKTIIS